MMVSLLLLQTSRSGGTGCGQQSDLRSASLWPGLALCAGELFACCRSCQHRAGCYPHCGCIESLRGSVRVKDGALRQHIAIAQAQTSMLHCAAAGTARWWVCMAATVWDTQSCGNAHSSSAASPPATSRHWQQLTAIIPPSAYQDSSSRLAQRQHGLLGRQAVATIDLQAGCSVALANRSYRRWGCVINAATTSRPLSIDILEPAQLSGNSLMPSHHNSAIQHR